MPSFELFESVGHLALGGPRLYPPFAGSERDPVVITGAGAHIVVNEMMLRPPPYVGRDLKSEMRHAIGRNQSAISNVPRESRRLRSHCGFTHRRVNTVGAYDNVGIGGRAIVELHFDAISMLSQSDASMIKMEHIRRHSR